jgi:hypothetical protein
MAITTYAELSTAISDRYAVSDFSATHIAEFVALTEARMQRELRTVDMEVKTEAFNLTGEYTPLPVDFLAIRDFYLNGATRFKLRLVAPESITEKYNYAGTPRVYAIVGRQVRCGPTPSDTSTTLVYYSRIPALSAANTQNWLLRDHPDAYLYGALTEAAIKKQDGQGVTGYGNLFSQALQGIQGASRAMRAAGPPLVSSPFPT